jgi:uroporphyrinogen decarboxylase
MKPQMTPRERILAAMRHEPTDRVPTDYWGVWEITEKLMKHFGVKDYTGLVQILDIDKIMGVGPVWIHGDRKNAWDIEYKRVPLPCGGGFYDEPVRFPIERYETIDEIEANYTWPDADMFDYSGIKAECLRLRESGYAVEGGYISLTYFYSIIRGIEQMLLDFAENPTLAEHILFRINEFSSEHVRRILEAGDGLIDITQVTDDFGMQSGLLMSKTMIDGFFGKYYDRNIKTAKDYNAVVFHHDDGAVAELIPWLVGKGCEVLNPLQWRLPGWNLGTLKRDYGKTLCFHGGIDNQYVLPFGTEGDVRNEVRTCVEALYLPDRTGYILAPCHNIQVNTSVENVLAMYDEAHKYSP